MEEASVKQGLLHLQQQQTFGKKWKKVWALLYGKSTYSIARLELYDGSNPPEKTKKPEKKVIKLSDCVRVSEANGESIPKGTSPFLLETTDRMYLLAAESAEQEAWICQLCKLAFPNRTELSLSGKETPQRPFQTPSACVTMEENSLYSMAGTGPRVFEVTVRSTEASERCYLRGVYTLKAQKDALELWERETGKTLYAWPYKFLRRFGRDKVTFSFEAGRRCTSGEGSFEFETRQGSEIFLAIETAISVQKINTHGDTSRGSGQNDTYRCVVAAGPLRLDMKSDDQTSAKDHGEPAGRNPHPIGTRCSSLGPSWEAKSSAQKNQKPSKTLLPTRKKGSYLKENLESPYSEPSDVVPRSELPGGGRSQDRASKKALESEYAVPFDTIAKSLMTPGFSGFLQAQTSSAPSWPADLPPTTPDPLYNSIEELSVGKVAAGTLPACPMPEHIYDEPEGRASHAVYDEPEEVKGEAWKLQATEPDPLGHEYPYNPNLDDYSVPKKQAGGSCVVRAGRQDEPMKDWLEEGEYDNVVLKNMNQ